MLRLLVFSSRFMSLAEWDRLGMFERETALYRRLQAMGAHIGFVTYGGPEEDDFTSRLPGMSIHPNRWRLKPRMYERLLPFLHGFALARASVLKTNQASSVYAAGPAARFWRKPLLARMGFLSSDFAAREQGKESAAYRDSDAFERRLFLQARHIAVTTPAMAIDIAARLPIKAAAISVIPNYVDTDRFLPQPAAGADFDVLFVGRLAPQKNLPALLEALGRLGLRALIVGEGQYEDQLRAAMSASKGRIEWRPRVAHPELPQLLARARLFVLPSLWEGHPKSLLEAMACGKAVLGADVSGIREQIDHGRTGWLCPPDAGALTHAIHHLLDSPELLDNLGKAARLQILQSCSLEHVAQTEFTLLTKLARGNT